MSTDEQIHEKLSQTGVFFWDVSADRVFEVSDNLRDFFGVQSNRIPYEEMLKFFPHEEMDISFRNVGLGESEWHSFIIVGGREYCLRCVKLSQYFDAEGKRHSVGTSIIDDAYAKRSRAQNSDSTPDPRPMSIFDGKSDWYDRRRNAPGYNIVYDQIADMVSAFRDHFPSDVVVSAWQKVDGKYLCVAVSGEIVEAERHDIFKVGFCSPSAIMDKVTATFGVQVFNNLDALEPLSPREARAFYASGWKCGAYATIRSIDDGLAWGFVGCFSSQSRLWWPEEKQRLQLLSDSISVLLTQSSAYSQLFHNLAITRLACEAGGLFTWQWDVTTHRRTLVQADGTAVEVPYELAAHHDDRDTVVSAYKAVECGLTSSFSIRARIRARPGEKMRWYDISARAVTCDEKGCASVIVAVAHDVDAVVHAEEAKKKEREQRDLIYNKMPAVIILCDAEGRQVYVNDKGREVFGVRSVKDRDGISVFDSPLLTDEQKNEIRTHDNVNIDFKYDFKKVAEAGYYRTRRTDVVEMNLRSSKLYTGGVVTGYLIVFTDLSLVAVQKRRLALFTSFFAEIGKSSKLGVCQFGPGGFASMQWNINMATDEDDTSFTRHELVSTTIAPDDVAAVNIAMYDLRARKIFSFQREIKVVHADGLHNINLHLSYSDAVDAVTAISIDVTEDREKEVAMARALQKAEQVESLRSRFFNNISHEIRTPLNSIVGFSDLIAQTQNLQGDMARYSAIIRRSNIQLLNIVDGIMELSQLQTGNRRFERQMVDVDSIIASVQERMDGQQAENVRFITPHEKRMEGLKAPLDKLATAQILSKLVDNAFRNTTSGYVMLWASVEDDNVLFHVADTGCGIPDDKLDSIFDVFVKVDEFSTGAGLGLPVCRELARQLGGDVCVESTVGRGSHFFLRLPLFAAESAVGEAEGLNVVTLPHAQDLTLAISLIMPRCNVFSSTRMEFSKIWMENRPKLSIIDVRCCADIAEKLIENIQAFGPTYKTLIVNTRDSGVTEDSLLKAGASAVVMAPLTQVSLARVVAKLMGPELVRMPSSDYHRIVS